MEPVSDRFGQYHRDNCTEQVTVGPEPTASRQDVNE